MRWMKIAVAVVLLALVAWVPAQAKKIVATPVYDPVPERWDNEIFWQDDIEGDVSGWSTDDLSAGASPHFHRDTYLAYEGTYSWWCGTFDHDTDGGYGNSWDDRLNIPPVDLSSAGYPILTYAYRHDSEVAYDFTWVQAESNGVFVDLNRGYDGAVPWTDIGIYGFVLATYDNPFTGRFRFVSDGAWSDEDGLYSSNGGAFHCDIVKVFDYFGGYVFFYDDAEDDVDACVPSVPSAAGDYWHVIDRMCPALSDPHSWWCGDDADTSLTPPNLQNALYTPVIDISGTNGALSCTAHFAMHFAVPEVDNDYCAYYGTCDGVDYYGIAAYWGDFGQCDGWGSTAYNIGFDVGQFCSGRSFDYAGFLFIFYSTDNGCGPGAGGDAGVMVDDIWFEGVHLDAVERASWGKLKALYR